MEPKAARMHGITSVVKYIFAGILTILTCQTSHSVSYAAAGLFELVLVFFLSDALLRKNRLVGNVVNAVLMLLYCAQMAILYLGGSYLSSLMVANLNMAEDLGGKATVYVGVGAAVVIVSLLPIETNLYLAQLQKKANGAVMLSVILVMTILTGIGIEKAFSPYYAYTELMKEQNEYRALIAASAEVAEKNSKEVKKNTASEYESDSEADLGELRARLADYSDSKFFKEKIADYRTKADGLSAQPNVILIFTEGLSRHIIEDERNIMPNVQALAGKSLQFENYYNHTAATFNGLIGQLYSGYQLTQQESNGLISLQAVFAAEGYHTAFINTEPVNKEFTEYLETFAFDELLGKKEDPCSGIVDGTMSDKEAYEMLFETAEALSKEEKPFFLSIYTFGTHISLDAADEKYGDGSSAMLNKFYDADQQFGAFMKKLEKSGFAGNTIVVFTADHCTCNDQDFAANFESHERDAYFVDEIPLYIYHKGVTPEVIDVNGMNSLDLAPTICDYLDISTPNCFLGESLFRNNTAFTEFDTTYFDGNTYFSTKEGKIIRLDRQAIQAVKSRLVEYFVDKKR